MSYKEAFKVAAILVFGFSMFFLYAVKDPDMKRLRKKIDIKFKSQERKSEGEPSFEELSLI